MTMMLFWHVHTLEDWIALLLSVGWHVGLCLNHHNGSLLQKVGMIPHVTIFVLFLGPYVSPSDRCRVRAFKLSHCNFGKRCIAFWSPPGHLTYFKKGDCPPFFLLSLISFPCHCSFSFFSFHHHVATCS